MTAIPATGYARLLNDYDASRPRSTQAHVGPSEIGFCRRKTVYKMADTPPDPQDRDLVQMWAADVGTAVHAYMDEALAWARQQGQQAGWPAGIDTVVLGSEHGPVTATLDTGDEITGTFDFIVPALNLLVDIKTVNGLSGVSHKGVSQNHNWQRHLYALACVQAGLLQPEPQVANLYLDRSGVDKTPLVLVDDFDPTVLPAIEAWIEDVKYAAVHGPDTAAQDLPAPVCERICEYFQTCRGVLPDTHDIVQPITHPDLISAVDLYVEGRSMEAEGKRMKQAASIELSGVAGSTGEWQVRWTQVNRDGYSVAPSSSLRLDIRKARKERGVSP